MAELDDAIESLYRTYARYRRPLKIEYCPCGCTKDEATAVLVASPLRELQFPDLDDYSLSAMTTQGTEDDFRYLLPGLLQGIASEPYGYNLEILFVKLDYGKWMSWPEDEVTAVRFFLHALWEKGLASFPIEERIPAFFEIETLLASIACTGDSLEPYLKTWTETKAKESDKHLIQFVTMYGDEFADGRTLREAFWKDIKPQADELRRWLLRVDTIERIENSAHLLRVDGYEHLVAPALEILRNQSRAS